MTTLLSSRELNTVEVSGGSNVGGPVWGSRPDHCIMLLYIMVTIEISSTALTGTSILSVTASDGDATASFRSVSI